MSVSFVRRGLSSRFSVFRGHGTARAGCQRDTPLFPRPRALPLPCQLQVVLGSVAPTDASLVVFQVNEIYHDESLGAHINVVLVRIILLSYGKVSEPPPLPYVCGVNGPLQRGTGLL